MRSAQYKPFFTFSRPGRRNYFLLLLPACFSFFAYAETVRGIKQDPGCFSIVVGKGASADGSVMFGHNEDVISKTVNFYKVPAGTDSDGNPSAPFLWINATECDVCATYMNEWGVTVGSDACSSVEDQPVLTDGGILFQLRRTIAEKARTARDGVKIAGRLIERYGYTQGGRAYIIADQDEAWILAVVYGKHWVAQRVPDDKVAVIPNCYTIEGVDLRDTANFLGSPDLVEYACRRGWFNPEKNGAFNFAMIYGGQGSIFHPGNTHRSWRALDILTGIRFDVHKQLPFAVKPNRKLTPADLMEVLRDRCEQDNPGEPLQGTICHDGTMYSFVAQIRNWMPKELKPVLWLSMYHPDLQGYTAWYPAITDIPDVYAVGNWKLGLREQLNSRIIGRKRDRSVAFSTFVNLDERVRSDYGAFAEPLKLAWKEYQDRRFKEQAEFEKMVMGLKSPGPKQVVRLLTEQTGARGVELYRKAGELLNRLPDSRK